MALDKRHELIHWVHPTASPSELEAIQTEYRQRLDLNWMPAPTEVIVDGQRQAACYFSCLPGDLATLGGVRTAADQFSNLAAQLLISQIGNIRLRLTSGLVQAAIEQNDVSTQRLVRLAGFEQLTEVDQLWLNLENHQLLDQALEIEPPNTACWQPASSLSRERFLRLLGSTFEHTLDCPELNDVRSLDQVLDSFLMGKSFRECKHWYVISLENRLAGCLLLTQHNRELIELAYMGLAPWARGKKLGLQLIAGARQQSIDLGATMLVVAADVRNAPAMQLYKKQGFQFHRRLRVFWHH